MIAGLTKGQDLHRLVVADPAAGLTTGILAPGGYGKTAVLDAVRGAYRRAGFAVVDGADLGDDQPRADVAVLVDDAHTLDPALLHRVSSVARRRGARVLVAFRPWPRPRALTLLTALLRRSRPLVVLQQLGPAEIDRRTAAVLGHPPSQELVDLLLATTIGQPRLVDVVLRTIQETGSPAAGSLLRVPAPVLEELGQDIGALAEGERAVLHAVAAGSSLDADVLAPLLAAVLDLDPAAIPDLVQQTRATGFLLPDGSLAPLVRDAVLASAPPERTRSLRLSLLDCGAPGGAVTVGLARELADDGVHDPRVTAVLERAADGELAGDPALALALYDQAVAAGADPGTLAARRAGGAARAGRLDAALQFVDAALADPAAPDLPGAVDMAATVLAQRGLLRRSADLYRWLEAERAGAGSSLGVITMLGIGARGEAEQMLACTARAGNPPTMVAGAQALMAQGVWESVTGSATAALSTLSRASTLLEPAGSAVLLPDTPAALTALVAIHVGELDIAESALRRAVALEMGGRLARRRHHLLLAWIAMLRGQVPAARGLIAAATQSASDPASAPTECASGAGSAMEPRDELFYQALQVGLARRTSDVPALVGAWSAAREAIVRHPVDLFALLPLAELTVAAARLREGERMSAHLDQAWNLLAGLGEPVLWATPLHWSGVHAAILSGRPDSLEPHAKALVRAARSSHVAGVMAAAGRAWMHVLAGDVDADAVHDAARSLQTLGLTWDASRLLAQAAARATERRTITSLLQAARVLQESVTDGHADADRKPLPAGRSTARGSAPLSAREREVADLLLRNRTYREIGDRLFISPKTVEHHVARIKQRIGAADRSELFAKLRITLGDQIALTHPATRETASAASAASTSSREMPSR